MTAGEGYLGQSEMPGRHSFSDAFEAVDAGSLGGPRQYRRLRQRARIRVAKTLPARPAVDEEMEDGVPELPTEDLIDRATLCLPDFAQNAILHGGEERFKDVLRQYYPTAESNAAERLVDLKTRLREASTHDFWAILMEEMCNITGSQCGFVAKRMLVDDQDRAVEMPSLGEPGSCLVAVAFYVNNGVDKKELHRDYRYHAYGTPCAHMKYDKVFIIPERMAEFVPNNPNDAAMPWKQTEAFIGVPLFSEGKCIGHFGLLWSSEGAPTRRLGWSFIEMFLHSLEDMILQRIVDGRGFAKAAAEPESTPAKVIPLSAITASQSLKPYARSLSHELRTPMQGVVGMLDIMYSTILDSIANQQNQTVRRVFEDLKNHIEIVQDSSRRAVEAADNVVHAYDLDMQMPDTPLTQSGASTSHKESPSHDSGSESPLSKGKRRERTDEADFHLGPPLKRMFTMTEAEMLRKYYPDDVTVSCGVCGTVASTKNTATAIPSTESGSLLPVDKKGSPIITSSMLNSDHRRVVTREFMQALVNDALRLGHPISEIHTKTDFGEAIEVKNLEPRGEIHERKVCLNIMPDVPEVIIVEEHHLQFALQKIVNNAIKFTDNGCITITVKLAESLQLIEIWVADTGCGMTEESKMNLFKPHFQEDASMSRSRDGLGLSLFNAKAHVRRNLGGDVTLERSETQGSCKGSEFLVRLPVSSLEVDNIDAPLVGTPSLPTIQLSLVPSAGADAQVVTEVISSRSRTASPARMSRKTTPKAPHQRLAFNSNLAAEYPLNILLAEDNAINRKFATTSLSRLGYAVDKVTIAFDGAEAVQYYKESLAKPLDQQFDVVLMDIWMPNMDGFEATREILSLATLSPKDTKIIPVTADITEECLSRAKAEGMQGFLAKPYKVIDMEHLILQHFEKED